MALANLCEGTVRWQDCRTAKCFSLKLVDSVVNAFFVFEMLAKMLSQCALGHRSAYFASGWNRLDFLTVIASSADYINFGGGADWTLIRVIKILRPLRAVKRIPSLRLLVTLLCDTLPALSSIIGIIIFTYFIFGIIGVQLWSGVLRNRCFLNNTQDRSPAEEAVLFLLSNTGSVVTLRTLSEYWPKLNKSINIDASLPTFYESPSMEDFVCGGLLQCNMIAAFEQHYPMCETLYAEDLETRAFCKEAIQYYNKCEQSDLNPFDGGVSFDNIFIAFITIFQAVSPEGWTTIMYTVQDASSFWVWPYFVFLFALITLGVSNLSFIVIATQIPQTKRRLAAKMLQERSSIEDGKNPELTNRNLYAIMVDLLIDSVPKLLPRKCCPSEQETELHEEAEESNSFAAVNESRLLEKRFVQHPMCVTLITMAIVANAISMAVEHHEQPIWLTHVVDWLNVVFTALFTFEVLVTLYAHGFIDFIRNAFWMLDLVIVVSSLAELALGTNGQSNFTVLRTFRLLRLLKLLRFLPALQNQLNAMFRAINNIAPFLLLLSLYVFIFVILGVLLYGCDLCSEPYHIKNNTNTANLNATSACENDEKHEHFDSLLPARRNGLIEHMNRTLRLAASGNLRASQVLTQDDDWAQVLRDTMSSSSSYWPAIYFVCLLMLGNYVILSMLLAIIDVDLSPMSPNASKDEVVDSKRSTLSLRTMMQWSRLRKKAADGITLEASRNSQLIEVPTDEATRIEEIAEKHEDANCRRDYSLFLFHRENPLRRALNNFLVARLYVRVTLAIVLANCVTIAFERPSIDAESLERRALDYANYGFTIIFFIEAAIKIIAQGFVFGQGTYLRSGWNVLDCILVILSSIDMATDFANYSTSGDDGMKVFKTLRLLRTFRPLRAINRTSGLKGALRLLAISVKSIFNIVLICSIFFAAFAILGLQLFRGCHYHCAIAASTVDQHANLTEIRNNLSTIFPTAVSELKELLEGVRTRQECLAVQGLQWQNEIYNFDNFLESLKTLMAVATFDGWIDITQKSLNCVDIDKQPIRNYAPWRILYFLSFLVLVGFCVVEMLIGVISNNHKNMKERQSPCEDNEPLETLAETEWHFEPQTDNADQRMASVLGLSYPKWRRYLLTICNHVYFDVAVTMLIIANILVMAAEHHNMFDAMLITIKILDSSFTVIFTLEAVMKTVAFGPRRYFKDKWNQLDFAIVLFSAGNAILEESESVLRVPLIEPGIIRLIRIVRVIRALKLLKHAKGVRSLLFTVKCSLSLIRDMFVLLLLIFFIYATLGVELLGRLDCPFDTCEGLSRHSNFHNFGMAMLTLFRIFTGDNGRAILRDSLDMAKDPDIRCFSDLTYTTKPKNGTYSNGNSGNDCGLVTALSPLYFTSFAVITQFLLINLVTACLTNQLEVARKGIPAHANGEIDANPLQKKREQYCDETSLSLTT